MKKKLSKFKNRYVRVFSRHPSHKVIRKAMLHEDLAVIRLGSTTEYDRSEREVNSIESVKNSSNKFKMKTCFDEGGVRTAKWWATREDLLADTAKEDFTYPVLAKKRFGSRGQGMVKLNNINELNDFLENRNTTGYIFERFHNYAREYRLHVTAEGCFYTCRKMLKQDTPDERKWFRNDSNCVWFLEDNDGFDKPVNWKEIVDNSVKALESVGLDVGAVDLRVQSSKNNKGEDRKAPEFIVVEINSAPSFGDNTAKHYASEIPKILNRKYKGLQKTFN